MTQEHLPEKQQFLRVDVRGQSNELWQTLYLRLLKALNKLLEALLEDQESIALPDELESLATAALDYAKAKLELPVLENERIRAEVEHLYAQTEKTRAEARKQRAEAEALELANKIKRLRLVLGGAQALLAGEEGEEAIVFVEQIEKFLAVLNSIEGDDNDRLLS